MCRSYFWVRISKGNFFSKGCVVVGSGRAEGVRGAGGNGEALGNGGGVGKVGGKYGGDGGSKQKSGRKPGGKPGGISGGLLGGKLFLLLLLFSSLMFHHLVWISLCFIFPSYFFISSSDNLLLSICVNKFPNTGISAFCKFLDIFEGNL